jgi:hypothetical protein
MMRRIVLVPLLFMLPGTPACKAQNANAAVLAVLKQMERAEQTGDSRAWAELWDQETRAKLEKEREQGRDLPMRPQPTARYVATKTLVEGEKAATIAAMSDSSNPARHNYVSMRFVREQGAWKIADQVWSETAPDPASIYTLSPPEDGAFARAGSPWQRVPKAIGNTKYFKPEELRWNLQAAFDESFLYVRIEAATALPAPNSEVKGKFADLKSGVPRDWPVMMIKITGPASKPSKFTFDAADFIGDQATFDEQGKANSHRHFVAYSLSLRRGDTFVYSAGSGVHSDPLIDIHDRFFDFKIPLKTMGVDALRTVKLEIADANEPIGMIQPYAVKPYAR